MPTPPRLSRFGEYCAGRIRMHGARFSCADLHPKFVPYFNSGARIRVRTAERVLTGTVGATTGSRPAFLLMRRSSDLGSTWLLSDRDEILAVKVGRRYVPVAPKEA